jgi:hypothetical protein
MSDWVRVYNWTVKKACGGCHSAVKVLSNSLIG